MSTSKTKPFAASICKEDESTGASTSFEDFSIIDDKGVIINPKEGKPANFDAEKKCSEPELKPVVTPEKLGLDLYLVENLKEAVMNDVTATRTTTAEQSIKPCALIKMHRLTKGSASYNNSPAVFPTAMSLTLPRFSHLFKVDPNVNSKIDFLLSVRQVLQTKFGLEYKSVPMVEFFQQDQSSVPVKPLYILLQCASSSIHTMIAEQAQTLVIIDKEETNAKTYTMTLQDSGLRMSHRACKVEFHTMEEVNECFALIKHEDAVRVARQFALQSGASYDAEYPESKEIGLLQVWRERLHETWTNGTQIQSERNDFSLVMSIPREVDRNQFLPYLTDSVNGRKFKFRFPGSDLYCSVCRDNSKHSIDQCDKKIPSGQWPQSFSKLFL